MGTPDFAVPSLNMLVGEGYDVAAAVTQPDRPKGRGGKLMPPIVKTVAQSYGIRVFQPEKPEEIIDDVSNLSIDLCVTVSYGNILKKKFLSLPRRGVINVHASLLPLYRGPSPIHRAILNGDAETGVTTMLTDRGVDTGPILMAKRLPIEDGMYFLELHDKLAELGASALKETIPPFLDGTLKPTPQDEGRMTRAPMIVKDDGILDFGASAERVVNVVRAFSVWPGAVTAIKGRRVRVHKARISVLGGETGESAFGGKADESLAAVAAGRTPGTVVKADRNALYVLCGDGNCVEITELQFDGGRVMDISECWHNLT